MSIFGSGDDWNWLYGMLTPEQRAFMEESDKKYKEKNRKKTPEEIKKEREEFKKFLEEYKDYL